MVSAYLLTSTASTPIYGKLSGQFGRRPLLLPAIIPSMALNALGAYMAGQITRKTGRTRSLLVSGLSLNALGFLVLGLAASQEQVWVIVLASGIAGGGVGLIMPTSLVIAQNQAPREHVGLATGILLLLRATGGAFGATLEGALLALGRGATLVHGFSIAFLACVGLASIAIAIARCTRDTPLRTINADILAFARK